MDDTAPSTKLPVAIIGAGPIGLAAAAHLLGRGIEPLILEAGDGVGAAVRDWGHVPMFSPWRWNIDAAARGLLEASGWTAPPDDVHPTGRDIHDLYLAPLARLPAIASRLRLGRRVVGVTRQGFGRVRTLGREAMPFEIHAARADGTVEVVFARAVIDASGTWFKAAPAGASGLPAPGEHALAARIRYGMPDVLGVDRGRYAGRRVLVIGSGHSAIGTLLALDELARGAPGTQVHWAVRRTDFARIYGGGDADQLAARGALGQQLRARVESGAIVVHAPFPVSGFRAEADAMRVLSLEGTSVVVDEAVVATGLRPDLSMLGELRLDLDPALECPRALAPLIDPNEHSCGTVRPHGARALSHPEREFYIAGMKSYGRAPTFLLATGYEQVRSIAAAIAGDHEAADRVEFALPETGVCSGPKTGAEASSSCCPAPARAATRGEVAAGAASSAGCCGQSADAGATTACCDQPEEAAAATGCCGPAKGVATVPSPNAVEARPDDRQFAVVAASPRRGCCSPAKG
ncbi:MAG: NAD(P)-binding protein [Alphaproteobacteria bacterium]|nr:NAD(P)-binding protein [Alphaproteobacteria bacterium]